jgi:hypothetical protein
VAHTVDLASVIRPRVRLHLNFPAASPDAVEVEVLTAVVMRSSAIYGASQPTFRKEVFAAISRVEE